MSVSVKDRAVLADHGVVEIEEGHLAVIPGKAFADVGYVGNNDPLTYDAAWLAGELRGKGRAFWEGP